MSEPSKPSPATVRAYLDALPVVPRRRFEQLRRTIRSAAPQAEEVLSYRMPALRQHGILVYYAAFHDHLSLFLASPHVRRRFARELAPYSSGRGTLRFPHDRPLPLGLVRRLVRARLGENEGRAPARPVRPGAGTRRTSRPPERRSTPRGRRRP